MIVDVEKIKREVDGHRGRIERVGSGEVVITITSRGAVSARIVEYLQPMTRGPSCVGLDGIDRHLETV